MKKRGYRKDNLFIMLSVTLIGVFSMLNFLANNKFVLVLVAIALFWMYQLDSADADLPMSYQIQKAQQVQKLNP